MVVCVFTLKIWLLPIFVCNVDDEHPALDILVYVTQPFI